ncbi:MAG: restriction endonuclease subunit S [Microcoleaceae cyanobacterium]
MKNDQAIAAKGNNCMSDLPMGWKLNRDRPRSHDWKRATVGELIDGIEAGINVKCEERPPLPHEFGLVKISAVTWGTFDDEKSKTLPPNQLIPESTRIRVGDFLISRAIELVGACVIVERVTHPVYLSDKVLRVLVRENYKQWLLLWLRSKNGRSQIEQLASGNQLSMRNLTQASLKSIKLKLPSEDERDEIIRRGEKLFKAIDLIEQEYQKASKLLDRLEQATLAKAFRGELVPQDPNDEPAAVLLERIRAER